MRPLIVILCMAAWSMLDAQDYQHWKAFELSNWSEGKLGLLAIDSNGVKWMSSRNKVVDFKDSVFRFHDTLTKRLTNSFMNNDIKAIVVDRHNVKWFATDGAGLASYNDTVWRIYDSLGGALPSNKVHSALIDAAGGLWITIQDSTFTASLGTFDNGQYHLKKRFSCVAVNGVAQGRDSALWVLSTIRGGFYRYHSDSLTFRPFNRTYSGAINVNGGLSVDREGRIWFGTSEQGVAMFTGDTLFFYNTSNAPAMRSNWIRDVAITSGSTIWIATSKPIGATDSSWGLSIFSRDTMQFLAQHGLGSTKILSEINSIVPENDSTLWITNAWSLLKYTGNGRYPKATLVGAPGRAKSEPSMFHISARDRGIALASNGDLDGVAFRLFDVNGRAASTKSGLSRNGGISLLVIERESVQRRLLLWH